MVFANPMIQLCSNSKCPLTSRCYRAVQHHINVHDQVGLTDKGVSIRHYHPTGRGQYMDCNHYMRRI